MLLYELVRQMFCDVRNYDASGLCEVTSTMLSRKANKKGRDFRIILWITAVGMAAPKAAGI